MFKLKKKSVHYYEEMNVAHFLNWFEYELIPNLPSHSLIILGHTKKYKAVVEKILI